MNARKKAIMDGMIGAAVILLTVALIGFVIKFITMSDYVDLWAMVRMAFLGLSIGAYPVYVHIKNGDWNAN